MGRHRLSWVNWLIVFEDRSGHDVWYASCLEPEYVIKTSARNQGRI